MRRRWWVIGVAMMIGVCCVAIWVWLGRRQYEVQVKGQVWAALMDYLDRAK